MADHADILGLSSALVDELAARGKTVATAESCTGGWIAKAITDVPGSSQVLGYGIVSYSNSAKQSLLGVKSTTLEAHGAVSAEVVEEMASGALKLSDASITVAVSGIAGPDGGSSEKPVGTVWFAWAVQTGADIRVDAERQQFNGDRDQVRKHTVVYALQGIRERIA